jgi:hypothetical protein
MKFDKTNTCWIEVGSQKTEVKSQVSITTFIFKTSDFGLYVIEFIETKVAAMKLQGFNNI